jgi:hypothetical protein
VRSQADDAGSPPPADGGSAGPTGDSAGAAEASEVSAPTGPKCTTTPRLLIDSGTLWPQDAGVGISQAMDLAVSSTDLYAAVSYVWNGAIFRVPLRGGAPVLLTAVAGAEDSMLVTGDSVVYAESGQDTGGSTAGDIVKIGLQGGPRTVLASRTLGAGVSFEERMLATDGQNVYFAAQEGTRSVPLDGGEVQTLSTHTGALAVVGSSVVIADSTAGGLFSVPTAGGATTRIAADTSDDLGPVVACGSAVCWASAVGVAPNQQGTGSLMQLAPSGAVTALSSAPSLYGMYRLLFDGSTFFGSTVGDAGAEDVIRLAGTGGTPVVVTPATGIAVDDECLYTGDVSFGVYSSAKGSAGP